MNATVKEQILRHVVTRLEAINAGTSPADYASTVSRVVRGVVDPDESTGKTVLMLATASETPDGPSGERKAGGGPGRGTQYRLMTLTVDAWVAAEFITDADTVALGADIERAVLTDRYMDGHAVNSWWRSTTITPVSTQAAPVGLLRVEFQIQFRTVYGQPETPLPAA